MSYPNTALEKAELKKFLSEGSAALTRVEAERDFIKTSRADIAEQSNLSKRVLGRLLKVYHRGNFESESGEFTELQDLFEAIA